MSKETNKNNEVIPESILNLMEKTKQDMDDIEKVQRFGFFSIIPNPLIGDRYYSTKKEFNHKVVDRKVITEKRGIYTTGLKKGKGHDAYFLSYDTLDDRVQERLKEKWEEENKEKLLKVNNLKKKEIKVPFKYPGIQAYKDEFDQNPFERDYPMYVEPEKSYRVVDRKVLIRRKGIYTQPMKKGYHNTPGIYFSFIPLDNNIDYEESKSKEVIKVRPKSTLQKVYSKPFFPASLRKNECFQDIKSAYGLEETFYQKLKDESDLIRKTRNKKYKKILPKSAVNHMRPFTPASLGKTGRDSLFDQKIWEYINEPEGEKTVINVISQREKREYEQKHRKNPFYYNKTMIQSKFSPSIICNKINVRRNFPSFYRK